MNIKREKLHQKTFKNFSITFPLDHTINIAVPENFLLYVLNLKVEDLDIFTSNSRIQKTFLENNIQSFLKIRESFFGTPCATDRAAVCY